MKTGSITEAANKILVLEGEGRLVHSGPWVILTRRPKNLYTFAHYAQAYALQNLERGFGGEGVGKDIFVLLFSVFVALTSRMFPSMVPLEMFLLRSSPSPLLLPRSPFLASSTTTVSSPSGSMSMSSSQ